MPLTKRARIEIYLPAASGKASHRLRKAFEREFLGTFGGCTVIVGIKGLYLSASSEVAEDEIDLVYADTPFILEKNFAALNAYVDELRDLTSSITGEESVLIVIQEIYHVI